MKSYLFTIWFLILLLSCSKDKTDEFTSPTGSFIDKRDGHEYKYITIGNQIWMAEDVQYNLPEGCWLNPTSNNYLYNWDTAQDACPSGWKVPSDDDWKELEIFIGMGNANVDEIGFRGDSPAALLKSKDRWANMPGNNFYELSIQPNGMYIPGSNSFEWTNEAGAYWSSSEGYWARYFNDTSHQIGRERDSKDYGFSVRCIKK